MGPGRLFLARHRRNLPDPIFGPPRALLLALVAVPFIACGVKGPPQPPLVRVPVAPKDLTAQRRGDRVDLRFVVPAENTDGSRPANIERVDIYALTGPTNVSDEVLLKRGTRVASVPVKAPRDPDETVAPGDPISDVEPPQGAGLDQGAVATAHEDLGPDALQPIDVTVRGLDRESQAPDRAGRPGGRSFPHLRRRRHQHPQTPRGFITAGGRPAGPCAPCAVTAERDVRRDQHEGDVGERGGRRSREGVILRRGVAIDELRRSDAENRHARVRGDAAGRKLRLQCDHGESIAGDSRRNASDKDSH